MKAKRILSVIMTACIVLSMVLIMPSYAKTSEIIWCETFENGVDDWIFFDADGDSDNWNLLNTDSSGFASYRGDYLLASDSLNRSPDNYAVSPAIEVSREKIGDMDALNLSWYRRALSSYSYAENYTVYVYKEKAAKPVTVEEVINGSEQLYTELLSSGGKYERISVDFSSYIGETVRLVFRHHDCSNLQALMLDDISIDASYTNASRTFFGFEDGANGWSFIDADGDKSNWSVTSAFSYEGQKSLVSYSYRASAYNPKNYAVSPTIGVSGNSHLQLDWYAGASSQNNYKEHYAVYIYTGSDTPTAESISALKPVFEETLDTYKFTKKTVDLDPYIGYGSIRVIFYHYIPEGGSAQSRLLIDNVTVTGVAKQSHNATFLVDGAVYGDVKSYAEGEQIVAPDAPTKTGYTFVGWDPAVGTMGTADITFNAKFEAKTYNVTFMDGETQHAANTVKYGGAYTVPGAPTKAGYTFAGWVDASGNAMPANHTTDGDVTFYAKWSTAAFDAKFYLDAAKTVLHDTKSVEFGAAIPAPAAPSKTGYTFKGWSLDGSTVLADLGTMDTEGKNFIAVFRENKAKIYFYDGEAQIGAVQELPWGEKLKAPEAPPKAGYSFVGWFDADGNAMPATVPTADAKYYAKYEAASYTVTFKSGDEVVSSAKAVYGSTIVPPKDDPAKEGYTFKGWAVEDNTDIVTFDDTTTVPVGGVTYVAIFEVNSYKITYYVDNVIVHEDTVKYGEAIPEYTYTPDTGVPFGGWAATIPATMPAHDLSIYGTTATVDYKVTFVVKNGEDTVFDETKLFLPGLPITAPKYDVPEGYSFSGWELPKTMPAEDIVLETTLTKNSYSLKYYLFETDDKDDAYAEYTVPYGDKMPVPDDPSKPGYEFQGWDYDGLDTATMPAIEDGIAIFAIFTKNSYTVQFFDDSGKNVISSSSEYYGSEIKESIGRVKEGHKLIGWTLDRKSGSLVKFPYTVEGDLNFYPVYEANTYRISFDTCGGTEIESKELKYGLEIPDLPHPEKKGHTFKGWYCDDKEFAEKTMPAKNVALIAKWDINSYDATFYVDGKLVATVPTLFGQVPVAPTDPEKVGYTFTGWNPALTAIGVDGARYDAMFAAQPVNYEVLIYTMDLDGFYRSPQALFFTALADSTVSYNPVDKTGFTVDTDKSTLSGTVALDGSLSLEVYYARNEYSFTYIVDGVKTSENYYFGADIKAPDDPEKEGHKFSGWSEPIPQTMPARDVTTSALFVVNLCTIEFDSAGGSPVGTIEAAYGAYAYAPAAPTKAGYTFAGWYEGENKVELPIASLKRDYSLKAKWEPANNVYTVEVYEMNTEGEYELKASQEYDDKKTGDEVIVSEKYPKITEGFVIDDEITSKSGSVAADGSSVFKVYVSRNQYTLKFVSDGHTTESKVYFGATIAEPENPVKKGYVFKYWYVGNDMNQAEFPAQMPASDLTYNAKFAKPDITIVGYTENKYVDYRTTITFKAQIKDKPAGAEIYWYVNGAYQGKGETFTLKEVKANCTVQAKCVLNRETVSESGVETLNVNTGFFAKLVAFFKGLFGTLPNIEQY